MSVQSETIGCAEDCEKSHEFVRRGCSFTTEFVSWAGDLLLTKNYITKQSEVNDIRGGDGTVEYTYTEVGENCDDDTAAIPTQYAVESTEIRTGGRNTFEYAVPKNPDPELETNWDIGILQSENECGEMTDGGDILQEYSYESKVTSLCGTVDKSGGVSESKACYLDNRKSFSADKDNGLLVCIRTGFTWSWEILYAPKNLDLSTGLSVSDNVTLSFRSALSKIGITDEDVLDFGMI